MPAYMFANVEVTDAAGYEQYRQQVSATIEAYGGRYLVRGGATEVLEGDWVPKRMVILEFADMAQLKAWYQSPEYRPLIELRQRTATSTLVAVEGSQPVSSERRVHAPLTIASSSNMAVARSIERRNATAL